ncbi:MAG: YIP1 family protein [Chthoniobacterales bacterium]
MSDIHINRAGQNLGIFTQTEVQTGLDTGRFLGTDLAWRAGMENWKPLGQWADFSLPVNVPPIIAPLPVGAGFVTADGEKNLPSWEQKSEIGFFPAFGSTVKEVLTEPAATFSRMKETGGFATPFFYMLIAAGLGVVLTMGVQLAMQGVLGSFAASQNPQVAQVLAAQGIGMSAMLLVMLILVPIFLFVGSFVGAAIWHVGLMIVGGARKPYEATYRVYCYVLGSTALVNLVPCCGGIAALVWRVVAGAIGLSKVHEISTGKAVAAILLPLVFCCGVCGVGFYFLWQSLASNPEFMNSFNKALHH